MASNYPALNKYDVSGWRCQVYPYIVKEDQDTLTIALPEQPQYSHQPQQQQGVCQLLPPGNEEDEGKRPGPGLGEDFLAADATVQLNFSPTELSS